MNELVEHLQRQHEWSERTFGPGHRTAGVIDHIRKELVEIEVSPLDLSEWIDVAILALDGAWRAGYSPEEIAAALTAKQAKNEARTWPDWRTAPTDKAIEHKKCEWCEGGWGATRSSVSDAMVHTDTPVGRVICPEATAIVRRASEQATGSASGLSQT